MIYNIFTGSALMKLDFHSTSPGRKDSYLPCTATALTTSYSCLRICELTMTYICTVGGTSTAGFAFPLLMFYKGAPGSEKETRGRIFFKANHLLKARYHNPDIVSNSASENYCLRVVGKEVPDIRLKISFQIAKKAY